MRENAGLFSIQICVKAMASIFHSDETEKAPTYSIFPPNPA